MIRTVLIAMLLATNAIDLSAQTLKFMTYNIRYATVNDGADQWENRKQQVCDLIREQDPVAFGIQEGLHEQVQYMDRSLKDYAYLGVGRDTGKEEGEYCALFYKREELQVLASGTFWLSKTPEIPSIGWDASYKRICTYALFKHRKLDRNLLLLNTHFDHMGTEARDQSAALLLEKIDALNKGDHPVILMGDFNLTEDTEAIELIRSSLEDSREAAVRVTGPDATFNGFKHAEKASDRIDYIFSSAAHFKVLKSAILDKKYDGRYPSDHFPVTASMELISR